MILAINPNIIINKPTLFLKVQISHLKIAAIAVYLNDPLTSLYTMSLLWIEIAKDAGVKV
jgi:hypothetical protein